MPKEFLRSSLWRRDLVAGLVLLASCAALYGVVLLDAVANPPAAMAAPRNMRDARPVLCWRLHWDGREATPDNAACRWFGGYAWLLAKECEQDPACAEQEFWREQRAIAAATADAERKERLRALGFSA